MTNAPNVHDTLDELTDEALAAVAGGAIGEGNDIIFGGDGDDVLRPGDLGFDSLTGGAGTERAEEQDVSDLLIINNGDGWD